ncbi:hypothetical protein QBC34DRAFT_408603 [Podospora aff. communis PSN243]|uniref:Prion-inhibition and propagation HeLo domain-containing protein n=1 Tax=Podospora aff. communis PSN243 TaxID=3040156 RepID=A0AAV9GIS7_9PEZI|nr:hypothetical protein QBC34DRAFT_408603 [Podospora aff. communis PSN243]
MEIALGVISVTDVAVRCCSKLWALSNAWRDAPADIHHLRDDLTSTERFFGDIQEHVQAVELKSRPYKRETWEDSSVQQPELRRLVDDGLGVLNEIETIVDGLLACGSSTNAEQPLLGERTAEVGKRTKLLWLRQLRKVARLRKELAHVRSAICRLLISQNM